jgi:hypothetical protein
MTLQQAITVETERYVDACRVAAQALGQKMPNVALTWKHKAHIHALALARLRGLNVRTLAFTR